MTSPFAMREGAGLAAGAAAAPVFHATPTHAAEAFARASQRLRVLVVSAAPLGDDVPLDLRREWHLIQKEARDGQLPAAFFRLLPPTRKALQGALGACQSRRAAPHVLHFAGHGEPGALAFEDEHCRHAPLRREDLENDLRGKGVRLLVLNACHTATRETVSLAEYLVEKGVVDAAIGHLKPVPDAAAALFAAHVYRGLCRGKTVFQAFAAAQGALGATHPAAAASARLFGGDTLAFREIHAEPSPPMLFDGTTGRGRMPEVEHFFGRADEMVEMGRFFDDSGARAMALTGIGGIGKTALVKEAANRHAWRFPGGLVFAQVRAGIFGEPNALDLVKIASAALLLPEASGAVLAGNLLDHLERTPALLVFDNLEDLPAAELERLLRLLEQLPLNGSKALLTLRPAPELLREWPWLRGLPITTGLSPRAGAGFAALVARDKGVKEIAEAPVDERGMRRGLPLYLTLALGGHPKMIEVAVGLAAGRGLAALRREVPEIGQDAEGKGESEGGVEGKSDGQEGESQGGAEGTSDGLEGKSQGGAEGESQGGVGEKEGGAAKRPGAPAANREGGAERAAATELAAEAMEKRYEGLLATSMAVLGEEGRWLLGVLQVFPDATFTVEELEAAGRGAMGVEDEDSAGTEGVQRRVRAGLAEATAAGLVDLDAESGVFRVHSTVTEYLRGHAPFAGAEAAGAFFGVLRHAVMYAVERATEYGAIDKRLGHLFGLFEIGWGAPEKVREVVAMGVDQLGYFLYQRGHWELMERWRGRLASRSDQAPAQRAHRLYKESVLLHGQGKPADATALLREALALLDAIGDRRGRAAVLHQLAIIEASQGHYPEARALLRESNQINGEVGDRRGRAASLHQLAIIEASQGHYAEARALVRESTQIDDELGDRRGRAASLHELAIIEESQGNHTEARGLLRESIQIMDEVGDRQGRAASLHQLAIIEESQGNFAEARALLRESIQVNGEVGDRRGRAASLHELAIIEASQGHYAEARALLRESIQIKDEVGDRQGRGSSLHQLAIIEASQGHYAEARALLRESIQIKDEVGDRRGRAASIHLLAIIEEKHSNFAEARALLRESIRIEDELGNRHGRATSLHQLAILEMRQGDQAQARALLVESIEIKNEIGDRQGRATSLVMLGQLEVAAGRTNEGRAMVEEAVQILREIGSGQLAAAQETLEQIDALGDAPGRGGGHGRKEDADLPGPLALIKAALDAAAESLRTRRPEEALTTLRKAEPLFTRPDVRAAARMIEAQALFVLSRPEEALAVLDKAIEEAAGAGIRPAVEALQQLAEQIREMHAATVLADTPVDQLERDATSPAELATLLARKAAALARSGRPEEARPLLTRALAEADTSGHPGARLEVRVNGAVLLLAFGEKEAARQLLTEARPLAQVHARQALAIIEQLEQALSRP